MEIPVRLVGLARVSGARMAGLLVLSVLLVACATGPVGYYAPVSLDTPQVSFPNGRVTIYLTDEYGSPMVQTRVDFAWEQPNFFRTSGRTDSIGRITFSGVPEVASVSIDHPGGNYSRTLLVPQRGSSELRVTLETYGANQAARETLRRLAAPPSTQ